MPNVKKIGCLPLVIIFSLIGGVVLWGITIVKENKSFRKSIELNWSQTTQTLDSLELFLTLIEKQRNNKRKEIKVFKRELQNRIRDTTTLHTDRFKYLTSLLSFLDENERFWKQNSTNPNTIRSAQKPVLHELEQKIEKLKKRIHSYLANSEDYEKFLDEFPHKEFIKFLQYNSRVQ